MSAMGGLGEHRSHHHSHHGPSFSPCPNFRPSLPMTWCCPPRLGPPSAGKLQPSPRKYLAQLPWHHADPLDCFSCKARDTAMHTQTPRPRPLAGQHLVHTCEPSLASPYLNRVELSSNGHIEVSAIRSPIPVAPWAPSIHCRRRRLSSALPLHSGKTPSRDPFPVPSLISYSLTHLFYTP